MCDKCKTAKSVIDVEIRSKTKTITLCPNCIAESICNRTLRHAIPDGIYLSEISGKPNAVQVTDLGYMRTYDFTPEETIRFLAHQLLPNEFEALIKKGHTMDEFDLHADFYDDTGLAYQPLLKDTYVSDMKDYLKHTKLNKLRKKHIEQFLNILNDES